MRARFFTYVLAMLFHAILCAQEPANLGALSQNKTQSELLSQRIDTLVRYTRNQFYGSHYDQVIEVGEMTLKLAEESQDFKAYFRVSSLVGNAFLKIEDTIQAKRIFAKAVKESEDIQKAQGAIEDIEHSVKYNNARSVITARIDYGNFYAEQGIAEPAIAIYKETIPLAEKILDTTHLFILNFNIAELNLDRNDIQKATYYVGKTENYITENTVKPYLAVAKLNRGKLQFLRNEFNLAVLNFKESIELAEASGYTDPLIESYEFYSKAVVAQGDYKKGYRLNIKADSLKSAKYKLDRIQAIESVTAKFKLNQFEQDIKAQAFKSEMAEENAKWETTVLWIKIASGILVLAGIILYISYRKRKRLLADVIDKNKKYLEAKEKSEELAAAKDALLANITHELRTPMYGIIGVSSLLMNDEGLKKHAENLDSLKFSANYLLSLVNNVLELTKVNSKQKSILKKSRFDLRKIVDNVVASSRYINLENPNDYILEIDSDIPNTLAGDHLKLSQILINLIGNSTKFTDNGRIIIKVAKEDVIKNSVGIRFTILDSGMGISEENQKYIFNEFERIESVTGYQGSGLGLPIVKKLLALHNSKIDLKSQLGQGTEVSFKLYYDTAEEILEPMATNVHQLALAGNSILIVDDNKINQLVTNKILTMYGARSMMANNGYEAIEIAKRESVDLILMDINMPKMNGFEATEVIRTFNEEVPIIALTAVELEKLNGNNKEAQMNDFIIKPYDNEVFISTLLKHIGQTKSLPVS